MQKRMTIDELTNWISKRHKEKRARLEPAFVALDRGRDGFGKGGVGRLIGDGAAALGDWDWDSPGGHECLDADRARMV